MKVPRWAQVLLGIAIVGVFLGIGAIIAVTAYFQNNVVVNEATAQAADVEFDKVRQRFQGQEPLLEIRDGVAMRPASRQAAAAANASLSTLHILVWAPEEGKTFSINVPWWVVRMKAGPIQFSAYTSGLDDDRVKITPDDIERGGPGLVLDMTGHRRERVLLWVD